jgi:chromate transporter
MSVSANKDEVAATQEADTQPPTGWALFRIWLNIGLQSFGGGTATLYLIRRDAVERYGWLTDEEFARSWGICQIAPGINILGLVILIGYRVRGGLGVALALLGLLVPSAAITVALTAAYAGVESVPLVRAALRGVVPATVGLGLLLIYGMAKAPLAASRREGRASLALSVAVLLGSALLAALGQVSVVVVLWGAGAVLALGQWLRAARLERAR